MHPYLTDQEIKTRVFIISAFLAIGMARISNLTIESLSLTIPWWFETPSVLGFFGLFVWLFNNHLWKIKFIQQLEWFCIPNINGRWKAEIKSSHNGFDSPTSAVAIIRQTATQICISLETHTSTSDSVTASLIRADKLHKFELIYNYLNKPKADSLHTMSIHQGTVWLQIADDGKTLDGEYYSGRDRRNFGRITLKRR